MKRWALLLLLVPMVTPARAGDEIGYIETFALADDREEALKELVPSTDDVYYYTGLHCQNTGQRERFRETLATWIRRHNGTIVARARELLNRQALLDYEENPRKTLDYLTRELNLRFDHKRRTGEKTSDAPTRFDNASIGLDRLLQKALAYNNSLSRIEDAGLELVAGRNLTPDQRRNLLSRLRRPDYPGLVDLVVGDLRYRHSRGFGHHPVHGMLLRPQLDALLEKAPDLRNNAQCVTTCLAKLAPIDEIDLDLDVEARAAYLERVWEFVRTLDPVHNSLKANVLYNRLRHDWKQGVFDRERFMAYVKLPRDVHYLPHAIRAGLPNGRHLARLNEDFGLIALPPVGNEEPLVRTLLMHDLKDAADFEAYKPWIRDELLKTVFAETKIVNGIGDPETWASMLSAAAYKQLMERVDIDFAPVNPDAFGSGETVTLDLFVKNVPSLIVKIFRINTFNYYRETARPLNLAIDLDGLVASSEKQMAFDAPPALRVKRTLAFPELDARGVYVVELIGNGRSSRALVQKGRLGLLQDITPAGHRFTVLDERNRKVPDAAIWMEGRAFTPDDAGRIAIPFSTQPGEEKLIVQHGDFAVLKPFRHRAEEYDLAAGIYVDREALLRDNEASVAIRPVLRVAGQPASLKLLEEVRLTIRSVDHHGIASEKEVADLALHEDRDTIYRFKVPDDLASLEFTLHAKVRNVSRNQQEDLAAGARFALNRIDTTAAVQDVHVIHARDGYILEMRGKNGEPRPGQGLQLWFKHRFFTDEVHASLQTDGNGRCLLGALDGIARFRARGPTGADHTWHLRTAATTYPSELHGAAGGTLHLPLVHGDADLGQVSLLEQRQGRFVRDRRAALSAAGGFLRIAGLPAGNYSLYVKPDAVAIPVRITDGAETEGFTVSARRALEQPRLPPLHITGIATDADTVRIQCAHAGPFTRVHVAASRYLPAYGLFERLSYGGHPGLLEQPWERPRTFYESGRSIGDEYRYILDRKQAPKYAGNMLERPGLLLNPWAIRDTGAGKEQLAAGTAYAGRAAGLEDAADARAAAELDSDAAAGAYANLDFLEQPGVLLLNLEPDENGVVAIDRARLAGKPQLRILAVDPVHAVFREWTLEDTPVATRELRLAAGLDPAQRFAEQKRVSAVRAGDRFTIGDVTTATFETYDTIEKAYRLLGTLSGDATLDEFRFVLRWPALTREERTELYAKYACHELSFFLYHKDPAFFTDVIAPYLANKKDKTFLDLWLLGEPLDGYLEPWAFNRLNTAERVLLGRRLKEQAASIERDTRERNDLIPPDVEAFNRRFDTAVKATALEVGGDRAAMLNGVMDEVTEDRIRTLKGIAGARGGARARTAAPGMAMRAASAEEPAATPTPSAERLEKDGRQREAERREEEAERKAPADRDYYEAGEAARERTRRFFQKLDKTKEWAENNYYHLPIGEQLAGLVPVNDFWADYAAHEGDAPFVSRHLAQASRNFAEMMLALAVLDLPFEAGAHKESVEGRTFALEAAGPMVVYHKEILAAEETEAANPILVSQRFFRADDRYRYENNEKFEKTVTDEFLPHVVYGGQIVLTNPSASRRKLDLLLQIPLGAMPVSNGFYTRSRYVVVEPYATQTVEYFFYFPETGRYPHYPVTAARNEVIVAAADPFVFNVVPRLSQVDRTSWAWISQHGSTDEVADFLHANNIHRADLGEIAWRMRDRAAFERFTALIAGRHTYDHTLWSYGVFHNDADAIREYLKHSPFAGQCGLHLVSPLLALDPVERLTYEHLEYAPLVNARAHQVGQERKILNHRFRAQYRRFMTVLSYKAALTDVDELAVAYYLGLQDRVHEMLDWFGRVERGRVPEALQYDYMRAFAALYTEDLDTAGALAHRYREHPVDRWRKRFANLQAQLDERKTGIGEVADAESREQTQARLAATEPALELRIEAGQVRLNYRNLEEVRVHYYPMDIELLFSRSPFLEGDAAQFSFIQPVLTETLEPPAGQDTLTHAIPAALAARNVMIEAVAAGLKRAEAYYANTMRVDLAENYGQLRVTHAKTGKPLSRVYVKVYARRKDGRVQFFKDGYTDFRGRFDYMSLNTNEIDHTARLALLILSEDYGAVVREAAPPKR